MTDVSETPKTIPNFQAGLRLIDGSDLNKLVAVLNGGLYYNNGAPSNGPTGTGAGITPKGALLIDFANGGLYQNTGTLASPTWTGTQGGGGAGSFSTLHATGAVTLDSTVAFGGVATFSANPVFAAAKTIKTNVAAATLTGNAATVTNYFLQCTTPSLTTAAGASQAEVITLTGLAATDIAFVQLAGGTNTTKNITLSAVATLNTLTVTVYNNDPAAALNGTIIFNVWIMKA